MNWDSRACIDADPRIFFSSDPRTIATAVDLCHGCPVQTECADYRVQVEEKMEGPTDGVWAGVRWVEQPGQRRARPGAASRELVA